MSDLNELSDNEKIEKYPNQFYWEYKMDQNEKREQDQDNAIAQEKYNTNPIGSDSY